MLPLPYYGRCQSERLRERDRERGREKRERERERERERRELKQQPISTRYDS